MFPSLSTPGQGWLYNPKSGLCVDDPNSSTTYGTVFQLWTCNDTSAQRWVLPKTSGQDLTTEAETMQTSAVSTGASVAVQGSGGGIAFSGGSQLFFTSATVNSSFTATYFVPIGGMYTVSPAMTKASDYGQVTVSVDRTPLPNVFDGYAPSVTAPAPFTFGTTALSAGNHTLTFTATGTDPASVSNRYDMGVDTMTLGFTQNSAPVAKVSVPASVSAPGAMTADAGASASGGSPIVEYSFDFGDGNTTAGPSPTASHGYAWTGAPKTYTVSVTTTDATGHSSTASASINVTAPTGPSAKVDAAAVAPVNTPVPVSAATSTAGSSSIDNYRVDYGDNTPLSSGTSPSTVHTYTQAGTYLITMTETDAEQLTSTATTSITIGAPPGVGYVGRVGSEALAVPGGTRALNLHPAHDTSPGNALMVTVTLINTFYGNVSVGDSAGDTFTTVTDQTDGAGNLGGGDRTVTFAAFKTRGLNLSDTISVVFPNSAEHTIAIDEYSGVKAVDNSASASADGSNGTFSAGPAAATRAGDLVIAATGMKKSNVPAFTSPGYTTLPLLQVPTGQQPHYQIIGWQKAGAAGPFHDNGTTTGMWMGSVATFLPNILTASLSANTTTGLAPLTVNFDAGKSTGGLNPISTYAFDFGDGFNSGTPGPSTTATHVYNTPGPYTAKVTVTDSTGATDTATVVITPTAAQKPLKNVGLIATDAALTPTTPVPATASVTVKPVNIVTAGDTLVASMDLMSSKTVNTGSVSAVDSKGNTWTMVGQVGSDAGGDYTATLVAVNIAHALTPTDTITITWPGNKEHMPSIQDFSGVTAVDAATVASAPVAAKTMTPFSSGNVATTAANELLYGYATSTGGKSSTWDPAWTPSNATLLPPGSTDQFLTSVRSVTAQGNYAATGTTYYTYIAGILTLR